MAAAELAGLHKSQKRLSALKIVRDFSYSQEDFLMRCAWVTSPKLRAPAKNGPPDEGGPKEGGRNMKMKSIYRGCGL